MKIKLTEIKNLKDQNDVLIDSDYIESVEESGLNIDGYPRSVITIKGSEEKILVSESVTKVMSRILRAK